ncbi:hypothetical protein BJX99DRAFT_254232 [Aspergillus californicus]
MKTILAIAALLATSTAIPTRDGKCNVGAVWADAHDCHNFYECAAGGIPVRKSCGPGTAYSPKTGVCDYEWRVQSCKHDREHHGWESHGHSHGHKDEHDKWENKNGDQK